METEKLLETLQEIRINFLIDRKIAWSHLNQLFGDHPEKIKKFKKIYDDVYAYTDLLDLTIRTQGQVTEHKAIQKAKKLLEKQDNEEAIRRYDQIKSKV